jgi:hypothetical protein
MAAACLGLSLLAGCEKIDRFDHDFDLETEQGIYVRTHGYQPDPDLIDAKYRDTMACLDDFEMSFDYEERPFLVEIMSPDGERFKCLLWDGWHVCMGLYFAESGTIQVDEGVRALSHEMVHHAGHYSDTGPIMHTCGNAIDSAYNSDWPPDS